MTTHNETGQWLKASSIDEVETIIQANQNSLAHANKNFMVGFIDLLSGSRGGVQINKLEAILIRKAFERNSITVQEAYDAFWDAYGNEFVGRDGIQFRHLWAYISEKRKIKLARYTYREMLSECDKHGYSTDEYEQIEEFYNSNGKQLKYWVKK